MTAKWWDLVPVNDRTPCNPNDPWAVNHRNFWGKPNEPLETLLSPRLEPGVKLHVFSQYDTLYHRISEHRQPGQERRLVLPPSSQIRAAGPVIILGTPGIGKSVFLHYYAVRLLRDSIPFILYTFEEDGPIFRFFTPYSVWTAPRACLKAIVEAPGNPALNVPFLIDVDFAKHLPDGITRQGSPFFFVQAASPNEGNFSWSKQILRTRRFAMNPHPQDEILQCLGSMFPQVPEDKLVSAIEAVGPSLRTISDYIIDPFMALDAITGAVENLSPARIEYLIEALTVQETHTLLKSFCQNLPRSSADVRWSGSDTLVHTIANPIVMRIVVARWFRNEQAATLKLLRQFSALPQTAATAGWLFESWCHTLLATAGIFKLHEMTQQPSGRYSLGTTSKELALPGLPTELFSNVQEATKTGVYYVPLATNNPTYDSFCRVGKATYAFQMTLAKTHSLKEAGLNLLKTAMNTPRNQLKHFVFVVPTGRSFSFKPPQTISISNLTFSILYVDLDESARSRIDSCLELWETRERDDGMDMS
ncbi:hypothetical protein EXIGLDRAFT_831680 [Exidia glandulosa HHB12029]|uniref:Uncharacterized protein n=1 Tax=Exidia glandulosa HHB12029 TaxID=1314781 RepID=A0A165MDK0_EXIGL|nr:hypothetical protein EXIGLDRAFT_831680 [Exidia glandulosa HHB12029]